MVEFVPPGPLMSPSSVLARLISRRPRLDRLRPRASQWCGPCRPAPPIGRDPPPVSRPRVGDRQKLHGGIKAAQQHQTFSAGSGCPLVYCKVSDVWPGSGAESTPIRTS